MRFAPASSLLVAWIGSAMAASPGELSELSRLSVQDPARAITEGGALLDAGELADPMAQVRVLRLLSRASRMLSDQALTREYADRLERLAEAANLPVAQGVADAIRSDLEIGAGRFVEGLALATSAADGLRAGGELEWQALASAELCRALTDTDHAEKAESECEQAERLYREVGDDVERVRVANLRMWQRYSVGRADEAIAIGEAGRERAAAAGLDQLVSLLGDNLARLYVEAGQPERALALSRQALAAEEAGGRLQHAAISRANIARALSVLGRHRQALVEIERSIEVMRALEFESGLLDLLSSAVDLAEAAGDHRLALRYGREYIALHDRIASIRTRERIGEIEASYAARERERQIDELEQRNRIQQLEIERTRLLTDRQQAVLTRQRLTLAIGALATLAIGAVALLLWQLLREQRARAAELERLARTDPLTGIPNRRAFFEVMEAVQRENALHVALLLLDLDHFKRINDEHGHPAGDDVLRIVADTLQPNLRVGDLLARIGGEEFAVVVRNCSPELAGDLAERLRRCVAGLTERGAGKPYRLSLSIGLAMRQSGESHQAWYRRADQALYRAKDAGRDRVELAAD